MANNFFCEKMKKVISQMGHELAQMAINFLYEKI